MFLALFWFAIVLLVYTYVLFPLLVFIRGKIWPVPFRSDDITPQVTIIIAAHNEGQSIGSKLENIFSLNYPPERLDVVVASDGSTDETESIVRRYATQEVTLLSLPRVGKAEALDAAVDMARGEILVFSDANSMFDANAIGALIRPFADPGVGGVAGDQRYLEQTHKPPEAFGITPPEQINERLLMAASGRWGDASRPSRLHGR